jgi:hypothetical protein
MAILSISTSQVAKIAGRSHHTHLGTGILNQHFGELFANVSRDLKA